MGNQALLAPPRYDISDVLSSQVATTSPSGWRFVCGRGAMPLNLHNGLGNSVIYGGSTGVSCQTCAWSLGVRRCQTFRNLHSLE